MGKAVSKQPKDDPKKFVRGGRAGRGPGRVKGQLRPFGFKPNSSGYGKGPPPPPRSRGGWL